MGGAALCDDATHHDLGKRQRLDRVEQATFLFVRYEVVAVLEAVGHGWREQRGGPEDAGMGSDRVRPRSTMTDGQNNGAG